MCSVLGPQKSAENDEHLEQYQCDDREEEEKPRRSKERELLSKENVFFVKESSEPGENLQQTSSLESDAECSSKNLSSLAVTDRCQATKDETKKTEKEHYQREREHSHPAVKESQKDGHSSKSRCSQSVEVIKQKHHKQEYCEGSKSRSFPSESNSPEHGRRSVKYSNYRSRSRGRSEADSNRYYRSKGERTWSRERHYRDEPRRWEKCRYDNDYSSPHARGDSRERKFAHGDKAFDRWSQAYNSRSHKDHRYKSRWPHGSLSREEDVHRFSRHRADLSHRSVAQQHSGKHSRERHALPPVSARFEDSHQKSEKERNRKRQYTRAEGSAK